MIKAMMAMMAGQVPVLIEKRVSRYIIERVSLVALPIFRYLRQRNKHIVIAINRSTTAPSMKYAMAKPLLVDVVNCILSVAGRFMTMKMIPLISWNRIAGARKEMISLLLSLNIQIRYAKNPCAGVVTKTVKRI